MLSLEQKKEKKKNIAKSTCELFVEKGYVNITISEIAKVAGVGKGTIYEYFANKDEIIYELMGCLQENYDGKLKEKLKHAVLVKEKLLFLFDIYFSEDDIVKVQRQIYREYLGIVLFKQNEKTEDFNTKMMSKYNNILENIFKEAINKNEIIEESLNFIPSIFATLEGFFIANKEKQVVFEYIDDLFLLLKYENKEVA